MNYYDESQQSLSSRGVISGFSVLRCFPLLSVSNRWSSRGWVVIVGRDAVKCPFFDRDGGNALSKSHDLGVD